MKRSLCSLRGLDLYKTWRESHANFTLIQSCDVIGRDLEERKADRDDIALCEDGAGDDASQELFEFVERHVNRLATLEEASSNEEKSSLRTFCRIDVGLMREGRQLHWFVNEVERGPNTFCYGRVGQDHLISVADRFSKAFLKWHGHRKRAIY